MTRHSWRRLRALLVAIAAVAGIAAILVLRSGHNTDLRYHQEAEVFGFQDSAREAGLDFRMAFLPGEQGEHFKINLYDHGCGVAVGDVDGDGFDDVYFVNQLGPNALFRNKRDGTFENITERAGVALGDRIGVGAAFGDYDNDGDQDLFVTSTRGGNVLFRNSGQGVFEDATKEAGLSSVNHSQTAAFFDYDGDGLLDLFVTNTAKWTQNTYDRAQHYYPGLPDFWQWADSPREHNAMYRNNGNGRFTDVTGRVGLQGVGWGGDVAVFDYDEDGRLDLLVTNMFGASQLYRNDGGNFVDVTHAVLGRTSWGAIGSKAFDSNSDGRLDLLIVDMHSDMWLPPTIAPQSYDSVGLHRKYDRVMGAYHTRGPEYTETEQRYVRTFQFRYEDVVFGNTLFRKLPNGEFEEVSDRAGLETFWPWGIATGDFDNDGHEDVFLPAGMGHPFSYWPNSLMMNTGDGKFTDRAREYGIDPPAGGVYLEADIGGKPAPRSSRCAALADFTNSGRLDLVVNNFNDRPNYFRNRFPSRNYIAFRLTGTRSNRDAIGATVRIDIGDEVRIRQVNPAGGYLSQSSLMLHFGLGERSKVDRVEIRWPSGERQQIDGPAVNTLHRITEPK